MKKYLEQFHNLKLFHLKDIVAIVGNERAAKELLRNYRKQNLICQIRRDLYTVTDLATKVYNATKFEIGSCITPTSYLSYHTSLEYHGIAHQLFYDLYISSKQRFTNFEFDDIHYLFCHSSVSLGVYSPAMDSLVHVTDLERTVIDCMDRIDRAGGIEEFIHCLSLITYLDEEKLLAYLLEYNKTVIYQKTGFILSYFRQTMRISDAFISFCQTKINNSIRYLTTPEESPTYFSEWKLYAPENILSYLEQGNNELV